MSTNSMPLNPAANERMIAGRIVRHATLAVALLGGIILTTKAPDAGEIPRAQATAAQAAGGLYCEEWDMLVSVRDHGCPSEASRIWEPEEANEKHAGGPLGAPMDTASLAAAMAWAANPEGLAASQDIAQIKRLGCAAWGMQTAGPDYVCIVRVTDDHEGELPGEHDAVSMTASTMASTMAWVANISGLPAASELPRLVMQSRVAKVALLAADDLAADAQTVAEMLDGAAGQEPIAPRYNDANRTIYLPAGWSGATQGEFSVLVREMVHHLQNAAGRTYACPQERNALAYDAQARWLGLFDRTLEQEFGIDPYILAISMQCIP